MLNHFNQLPRVRDFSHFISRKINIDCILLTLKYIFKSDFNHRPFLSCSMYRMKLFLLQFDKNSAAKELIKCICSSGFPFESQGEEESLVKMGTMLWGAVETHQK